MLIETDVSSSCFSKLLPGDNAAEHVWTGVIFASASHVLFVKLTKFNTDDAACVGSN